MQSRAVLICGAIFLLFWSAKKADSEWFWEVCLVFVEDFESLD